MRIRVETRNHDATDPSRDQRVSTRRRAAEVGTGLERDEAGRPFDRSVSARLGSIGERGDLSVRTARASMPATPDHVSIAHQQTADARIRRRRIESTLRQFNGRIEKKLVGVGHECAYESPLALARGTTSSSRRLVNLRISS